MTSQSYKHHGSKSHRRAGAEVAKLPLFHVGDGDGSGGAAPRGAYVALVPGAQVAVLTLDLPTGLKGMARAGVARRQMADLFGRSVDSSVVDFEMRPVMLGPAKAAWVRALAVAPQERQLWLQGLGPDCRAVLPDYLALPWAPGIWTIAGAGSHIRARLAADDGFSAEPDLALALLQSAVSEAVPKAVLLVGSIDPAVKALLDECKIETSDDPAKYGAEIFAHGELTLDLALDPGAEMDDMRRALRPFWWPAVMAVLALGLWVGAMLFETGALRDQALAQRKNAERILRETMIPTGPILDMRAQVSQLVEARRGAADLAAVKARPVDVFRAAGEVLAARGTHVQAVSYQAGSGLVIDLKVGDFAALDQLVAALRSAGIELSVAQSTARENEGVEASLALVSNRGSRQ